jgi:signal transduction histidine kinase
MVNAAKWSGDPTVSVYAEVRDGEASVFVRDWGAGFDLDGVAPDRHGVRESIVDRMARHGGRASIKTAPGEGTEVELRL